MKQHGKVYSATQPQPIEITDNAVFIASNIEEYTKDLEGHISTGYSYDCVEYDKNEYLVL